MYSTGDLKNTTCPSLVPHAPSVTQPVCTNANNATIKLTASELNIPQSCSRLKPQLFKLTSQGLKRRQYSTITPKICPMSTDVVLTSWPTYKLRILYRILTTIIHTAVYLLKIGDGINLIRLEMIPQKWDVCIKKTNFPSSVPPRSSHSW